MHLVELLFALSLLLWPPPINKLVCVSHCVCVYWMYWSICLLIYFIPLQGPSASIHPHIPKVKWVFVFITEHLELSLRCDLSTYITACNFLSLSISPILTISYSSFFLSSFLPLVVLCHFFPVYFIYFHVSIVLSLKGEAGRGKEEKNPVPNFLFHNEIVSLSHSHLCHKVTCVFLCAPFNHFVTWCLPSSSLFFIRYLLSPFLPLPFSPRIQLMLLCVMSAVES